MRFLALLTPVAVLAFLSLGHAATTGPENKNAAPARAGVTFEFDRHKAFVSAAPVPAKDRPWLWYAPTLNGISPMQRNLAILPVVLVLKHD